MPGYIADLDGLKQSSEIISRIPTLAIEARVDKVTPGVTWRVFVDSWQKDGAEGKNTLLFNLDTGSFPGDNLGRSGYGIGYRR